MKTITLFARLALAALAPGACEPTELQVINKTDAVLEVSVWGTGPPSTVTVFLEPTYEVTLEDGRSRTWQVEPGRYYLEGWTAAGQVGVVTVRVAEGSLRRVPFYDPDAP